MKLSVWPGAGQRWADVLEVATYAEKHGWDGIWIADHFMANTEDASGDMLECWAVMAALAVAVPRVRLGTLVCGNTYRHPAVLANQAASVDVISGGRVILGIGGGWQENEHRKYGLDYFTVGERLRRLDEACQVIKALTTQERATFKGEFYELDDAPLEPRPVQSPLPLMVGGGGEKVTLRIAAQYADEWNVWGTPETLRRKIGILEAHGERLGRDPAEIHKTANALIALSDDQDEVDRLRDNAGPGPPTLIGTAAELTDIAGQYADAGVNEFIVPDWNLGTGSRRRESYDAIQAAFTA
ncbi:MAG: F420-dependent oxidoreductase-like protein [Glaciecola sp.]